MTMSVPREITKWLPAKDKPFIEAEADRLLKKGWDVEIQSKNKEKVGTIYTLVVLKDDGRERLS